MSQSHNTSLYTISLYKTFTPRIHVHEKHRNLILAAVTMESTVLLSIALRVLYLVASRPRSHLSSDGVRLRLGLIRCY